MASRMTSKAVRELTNSTRVERHRIERGREGWSELDVLCRASQTLYLTSLNYIARMESHRGGWHLGKGYSELKPPKDHEGPVGRKAISIWAFSATQLYHGLKNTPAFRTKVTMGHQINTKILKNTFRQVTSDFPTTSQPCANGARTRARRLEAQARPGPENPNRPKAILRTRGTSARCPKMRFRSQGRARLRSVVPGFACAPD